ncbi:TolC family protein, partial [Stenotrophomonas sp. HMWF022]
MTVVDNDAITGAPAVPRWWRLYGDATLDALVIQALENNRDLRIASANLQSAYAVLRERQGDRLPTTMVSSDVGYGSTMSDQIAAALEQTEVRTGQRYGAGFAAGWSLDLFGRIARSIQAARADAEAIQATEDSVRVVVAAETTRAYVDSCGYASRAEIARRSLALVSRSLALKTAQRDAGDATSLDVARAAALVEHTRAAIPALEAGRQNALYALAVLTGRTPDDLPADATSCVAVPQLDTPLPIGDVSALLQRRPDIREAQRRLEASTARIGVATASLYPTVSILGTVASSAPTPGGLTDHGSIAWNLGPALSWRFPNSSAARAQIADAEAQEHAALARFDAVILATLKDVKQALATYQAALRQHAALKTAAVQSGEALRLAQVGRHAGAASELDVLEAERRDIET